MVCARSVQITMCLTVGVVVSSLFSSPVTPRAFEAAFQGSCGEKNPCEQLCYDLYDGTFECGCRDGAILAQNGYSCSEEKEEEVQSEILDNYLQLSNQQDDSSTEEEDQDDDRDVADMKNTLILDGRRLARLQSFSRTRDHPLPLTSNHPNDVINNEMKKSQKQQEFYYKKSNEMMEMGQKQCTNLKCEQDGGQCLLDSVRDNWRCHCSLGRSGAHCQQFISPRFPRFFGHSYLTLPVLKNAFRNFQIALEFYPETSDGLLLFSGNTKEKATDLMALILVNSTVEFRFDCGSGMGIVRSAEPVVLKSWNRLVIYRHRWDAWLQLNGGLHTQGRSKGLMSRITFHENLFVGGMNNFSQFPSRLQTKSGLIGCIRYLEINEHPYDLRPYPKGEALSGRDLTECNSDLCTHVVCVNGGTCSSSLSDKATCLCPLGFIGHRCENEIKLIMPSFNGTSYLKFPGLGNSALSFVEMSLELKPIDPDGIILYNGYKTDGTGDFLSLSMWRSHVEFRFDLGTGPAVLRSRQPVTLNEWHNVFLSRTGRDGILEVDRQQAVDGMAQGAFTQLSLPQNLYLGGVPNLDDISHKMEQRTNFKGCIQKLVVNNRPIKILEAALSGINIGNCDHLCIKQPCLNQGACVPHNDRFSCHCQIGFTDTRCQTEVLDAITVPMFSGNSYLKFTQEEITKRIVGNKLSLDLKMKATVGEGLILWIGEEEMTSSSDFLAVGLYSGLVHLRFNLGSGEGHVVANHSRVDDGHWHQIRVTRAEQEGFLTVDRGPLVSVMSPGPLKQLNTNNGLYLGGMENILHLSLSKYSMGLTGCISELRFGTDLQVDFVSQATSGMNIRTCM